MSDLDQKGTMPQVETQGTAFFNTSFLTVRGCCFSTPGLQTTGGGKGQTVQDVYVCE